MNRLNEWLENNDYLMLWPARADSSGFEDWRGREWQVIVRRRIVLLVRFQRLTRQSDRG